MYSIIYKRGDEMMKINEILDRILYWILFIILILGLGILIKIMFFGGVK